MCSARDWDLQRVYKDGINDYGPGLKRIEGGKEMVLEWSGVVTPKFSFWSYHTVICQALY